MLERQQDNFQEEFELDTSLMFRAPTDVDQAFDKLQSILVPIGFRVDSTAPSSLTLTIGDRVPRHPVTTFRSLTFDHSGNSIRVVGTTRAGNQPIWTTAVFLALLGGILHIISTQTSTALEKAYDTVRDLGLKPSENRSFLPYLPFVLYSFAALSVPLSYYGRSNGIENAKKDLTSILNPILGEASSAA